MDDDASQPPNPLADNQESRPGLLRVLGLGTAIAIVVGNVIGSGIFLKPATIARDVGDVPLIVFTWCVGGGLCYLGGLCFAELGAMLPRAGGLYVFLREAYGRLVAFLFGWTEFLFGRPASIGALAVAFVYSMARILEVKLSGTAVSWLAIACIVPLAWINILGVAWGGAVQVLTTVIKAGFLGVIALAPFVVYLFRQTGPTWENFQSEIVPQQTTWAAQFAAAMLAVMWAYNGWHDVTPVAEEVKDPLRNIPRALLGGIGLLILLYVGVNLSYHSVLSMGEVVEAGDAVAQDTIGHLFAFLGPRAAKIGSQVMSAVVACSIFGAINSNLLNGPRISFAMGRDDVFFRALGRVHVNYRTPAIAIAVQAVMSSVLVLISPYLIGVLSSDPKRTTFDILTDYVVFSSTVFYMLAVFAVIVLRLKHPEWERPYRIRAYPWVPAIYLLFFVWFLYQVFIGMPAEACVGMGATVAGIPIFYWYRSWRRRHPDTMHDGQ